MKKYINILNLILVAILEAMCFVPFIEINFSWETTNTSIYSIAKSDMSLMLLQFVNQANILEKIGMWTMIVFPVIMVVISITLVKRVIISDCINMMLMLFIVTYWLLGLRTIRQVLDSILVDYHYTIACYVESLYIVMMVVFCAVKLVIDLRKIDSLQNKTNIVKKDSMI